MKRLTEWTGEEWIPVQERKNGKIIGYKDCMRRLAAYENTCLEPEEIILFKKDYEKHTCTGCWLKDEKGIAKKIKELKDLLELAVEELENVYERETELTERIREVI